MRPGAVLALLVSLLLVVDARDVCAQAATPATNAASAKEAFRRGEAAYSAGNYEVAVREWTAAYAADPRPRIQFNLSQAYERMGQLENAIEALKRFIESGDPEDPTYSDANARLGALQQRLASTGVRVQGGTEGGAILVDGQDWGRTPRPDEITVKPGNHVIVVRWPSGKEFRANVYAPAGQVVQVDVPTEEGATTAAAPSKSPEGPPRKNKKRRLWYALGSGAGAAGVGLLAYGTARFVRKGICKDEENYCDPDDEDATNMQGIAGVAVGSALLAGGAALFVVGALARDDARTAKTSCGIGFSSAHCTFRF